MHDKFIHVQLLILYLIFVYMYVWSPNYGQPNELAIYIYI